MKMLNADESAIRAQWRTSGEGLSSCSRSSVDGRRRIAAQA
jgi:hypothetical protein